MSRRPPTRRVHKPGAPRVQESNLQHVFCGFVYWITVRNDGSWRVKVGDRECASGPPLQAVPPMTSALMIEAEAAARAAIVKMGKPG